MAARGARILASMVVFLVGCVGIGPPSPDPAADDPDLAGAGVRRVPAAARFNGRFEVWIRVNRARGIRQLDGNHEITLRASGGGPCGGRSLPGGGRPGGVRCSAIHARAVYTLILPEKYPSRSSDADPASNTNSSSIG